MNVTHYICSCGDVCYLSPGEGAVISPTIKMPPSSIVDLVYRVREMCYIYLDDD